MKERPAPGSLEDVREFVNTRDVEQGTDELESPADADRWLEAHGLPRIDGDDHAADFDRLIALREALRAMLLANNTGEPPPADALTVLNQQSSEAAVGLHFDAGGATLVTRCAGVDAVIARILAIVHGAMQDGSWARLKVCPSEDCLWSFYDGSRNRSATWCEMEECGNREKARRWRQRRRGDPAA